MFLKLALIAHIGIAVTNANSQTLCFIGDLQANYDIVDPRPYMGSYHKLHNAQEIQLATQRIAALTNYDTSYTINTLKIYIHTWQFSNSTEGITNYHYLFKATNIGPQRDRTGWLLAAETTTWIQTGADPQWYYYYSMTSDGNNTIACYRDPILNCRFREWYYGYNNTENAVPTIKILNGSCPSLVFVILIHL